MVFEFLSPHFPQALAQGRLQKNVPLAAYTTFRVGGPADALFLVANEEELCTALRLCKGEGIPVTFMGAGSNLLVRDGGIRGLTLRIAKSMAEFTLSGTQITAQAGASLAALAQAAANASLTGLEFASGIPGTLGGGAAMNAGAYGGEMAQVITRVRALHPDTLQMHTLSATQMNFSYRSSALLAQGLIATQATLSLAHGDCDEITARMQEFAAARREKQPLNFPSAGSTFKRPQGHFAAKLIDEAGLRGLCVGGAQVSPKHAGFIVNTGGATAKDILTLMEQVTLCVQQKFSLTLSPEVRILGEDA